MKQLNYCNNCKTPLNKTISLCEKCIEEFKFFESDEYQQMMKEKYEKEQN